MLRKKTKHPSTLIHLAGTSLIITSRKYSKQQVIHMEVFQCRWKSAPCYQTAGYTVYPKKYAHGFVVLCFVVVMQSFIMNLHEVFIHIHQGCFAGTGAIVRLPQCQWSKPDGYGKISQCITTTKHSKAKTLCIFLGIYCISKHCQCFLATPQFRNFMRTCVIEDVSSLNILSTRICNRCKPRHAFYYYTTQPLCSSSDMGRYF